MPAAAPCGSAWIRRAWSRGRATRSLATPSTRGATTSRSENNDHIRHEVVAARYLQRNPELPVSAAHGRSPITAAAAQVFPITANPQYELLTESGEFTSACSLTITPAGSSRASTRKARFVAEPVHNLVHRDVIEPSGATFVARRGREGREFLASTDAWFRPVNFYVGPDGALYVIDYYRERIEHPEWTASEFHKNPEQFALGAIAAASTASLPDGAAPAAPRRGLAPRPTRRWSPRCRTPTCGGGARRSGCCSIAGRRRSSRRSSRSRARARRRWAACTRCGRSTASACSTTRRSRARWATAEAGHPRERAAPRRAAAGRVGRAPGRGARARDRRVRCPYAVSAARHAGRLDSAESRAAQQDLFFAHVDDPWMQVAALSAGPDRAATYLQAALRPESAVRARQSDGHAAFFALAGSAVAATREPDRVAALVAEVARGGRATRGGRQPHSRASGVACVAPMPVSSAPVGPICSRWRKARRGRPARVAGLLGMRGLARPRGVGRRRPGVRPRRQSGRDAARRADAISACRARRRGAREAQFSTGSIRASPRPCRSPRRRADDAARRGDRGVAWTSGRADAGARSHRRSTCCWPTRRASGCLSRPCGRRRAEPGR